jgi:hypothetical protein
VSSQFKESIEESATRNIIENPHVKTPNLVAVFDLIGWKEIESKLCLSHGVPKVQLTKIDLGLM